MKEDMQLPYESNLYYKIQMVKEEFLNKGIKKSGKNKFAGFDYFELSDIVPAIIELCNKYKIFTAFRFNKDEAILEIVNIEKPSEVQVYSSPMEELELKGCNKIQALGGTETYQRRYLYMAAFDIIENDMFDSVSGSKQSEEKKATKEQIATLKKMLGEERFENMVSYATKTEKVSKIEDVSFKFLDKTIKQLTEK